MGQSEYLVDNIINSATWINDVLIAGATIAGTVCFLKLFKKQEVKTWGDLTIKLSYAWVIFTILTVAHFYTSYVFIQAVQAAQAAGEEIRTTAWNKLTTSSLLIFHGLVSRLNCHPNPFAKYPRLICDMDLTDPTTILAHVGALGLFFAIVRWQSTTWLIRLGTGLAAFGLCAINWILGSNWAINASLLSPIGVSSN